MRLLEQGGKMLDNKELAKKYGLDESHFWKHPQAGKWIISHEGAMTIADHEGIEFSKPEYIKTERDLIVLYGEATIYLADGQTKTKWSHGEASHKNCFMPYPYAMAEKRLKDRLTLMLIAAYGTVYSEIEAEEFMAQRKRLSEM